jgi:hypothetical protein
MTVERDFPVKKEDQGNYISGVNVDPFSFEELQTKKQLLNSLTQAYRLIFGGEPWNEWMSCSNCGRAYGRQDYLKEVHKTDPCCSKQALVEFHPVGKVEQIIASDMSVPNSVSFLFIAQKKEQEHTNDGGVIGFIWGYGASLDVVLDKVISDMPTKYGVVLQDSMLAEMPGTIRERMAREKFSDKVSYIAEIGISEGERDGIVLAQLMKSVAESQRSVNPTYLFWTQKSARIYPIAGLLDGKTIYSFDEKMKEDEHVFLAGDLNRLHDIFEEYPPTRLRRYFLSKMRKEREKS